MIKDEYFSDEGSSEARAYRTQKRESERTHEHIAGPWCRDTRGYHGDRISVEEMRGCHTVQCLLPKDGEWLPTSDDLDFELNGKYYLTGLCEFMPSSGFGLNFAPARHGVERGGAEVDFNYNLVYAPALTFVTNLELTC